MPHPLIFLIGEEEIKLDSASFTDKKTYTIGDRSNNSEEAPIAKISLVTTEKYPVPQVRIRICGKFHKEPHKKDPENWHGWGWIIIPAEELDKLTKLITKMNAFVHFRKEE